MDFLVTEMQELFFIFHDGLKAWWEKEAQEHSHQHGFRDRQLCCLDPTNENLPAYRHKVAGDSTEICRGLDSHGFADLICNIVFYKSITCDYGNNDPRKFKTGTLNELSYTMSRCWQIDPISDRIIEDIERFFRVLDIIIDHCGRVAPEMNFRSFRRAESYDKLRSRQRILTYKRIIVHSDTTETFDNLIKNS